MISEFWQLETIGYVVVASGWELGCLRYIFGCMMFEDGCGVPMLLGVREDFGAGVSVC